MVSGGAVSESECGAQLARWPAPFTLRHAVSHSFSLLLLFSSSFFFFSFFSFLPSLFSSPALQIVSAGPRLLPTAFDVSCDRFLLRQELEPTGIRVVE